MMDQYNITKIVEKKMETIFSRKLNEKWKTWIEESGVLFNIKESVLSGKIRIKSGGCSKQLNHDTEKYDMVTCHFKFEIPSEVFNYLARKGYLGIVKNLVLKSFSECKIDIGSGYEISKEPVFSYEVFSLDPNKRRIYLDIHMKKLKTWN